MARTYRYQTTKIIEQARFLAWLTSDGPIPARVGREVLRTQGLDHRNQERLRRAKQEAGIVSRRNGFGPGSACYWMQAIDTSPLPEKPNTWAQCSRCGWTARLAASMLPRSCVHTPGCPGNYQATTLVETRTPDSRPEKPMSRGISTPETAWSVQNWRPSPLRRR